MAHLIASVDLARECPCCSIPTILADGVCDSRENSFLDGMGIGAVMPVHCNSVPESNGAVRPGRMPYTGNITVPVTGGATA